MTRMPPREDESVLDRLESAFERAAKKLETRNTVIEWVIDRVETQIQQAITELESTSVDFNTVRDNLRSKLDGIAPLPELKFVTRQAEKSLDDFSNVSESLFTTNISDVYMQTRALDPSTVNQIVANYLYRQNQVEAGDAFIRQAGLPEASTLKSRYKEMHEIFEAIRDRNLGPAINWAIQNRIDLLKNGLNIEYGLHRQHYLQMLKSPNRKLEAIKYVQMYLTPIFQPFYHDEIKMLMGCLLWVDQTEESPYAEFLTRFSFEKLADEFKAHFLGLMGESTLCPLSTTVNAGAQSIHTMLKFRKLVGDDEKTWENVRYFPFKDSEVDRKYSFHGGFVCGECGQRNSEFNRPAMLPCQHVFCYQSIWRLSGYGMRLFDCFFCKYRDVDVWKCKLLTI